MKRERLNNPKIDAAAETDQVERQYQARSENDFMLFAMGLTIPSASGPKVLGNCIAPFQTRDFELLAPSLAAVRNGTLPPRRRFWLERTKKASKDADIAICLLWLMSFPKRPVLVQVSAANRQQAGIIKRRIKSLLYYNAWLTTRVKILQNRIIGKDGLGEVVIEATGNSGAKQGDTPDLLVLNELVHVEKWDVNETHMNNADGVPQGVVIISTNAGIKGTKAHKWKINAKSDTKRWTMMEFKGVAPWVDPADVADAKTRDPVGKEFDRLWGGRWPSGKGSAVSDDVIDDCFVHPGPLTEPETGWQYVAGLDLGVNHDHSALVLLGANYKEQRIRVAWLRGYVPSVRNDRGVLEVNADKVKQDCFELTQAFHICWFGYDPAAGGSFMAQDLRKRGVPMREMPFSVKNKKLMGNAYILALNDGRLECYEDAEGRLRRDFGKFDIVPKSSGYVLESTSDEWGHADVGTALVICLPKAIGLLGNSLIFTAEDVLTEDLKETPFTEEEAEEMPDEMKDICNAYKPDSKGKRPTINDW